MIFLTFPGIIGYTCFLVVIGVTVILNLVTATLITLRILFFQRHIRKTIGLEPGDSPYMTVLALCVESSALIVVFSLIYFILYFQQANASYIPMQLLVHVYVLSPLLIVYRVAHGKAATFRRRPSESGPSVSGLHFQIPSSNSEV